MPLLESTIAGHDVLILEGSETVDRFKPTPRPIFRPGVAASDYMIGPLRNRPFSIQTFRDETSKSDARSRQQIFDNLIGTFVAYTDQFEQDWENVIVLGHQSQIAYTDFSTGYLRDEGVAWLLFSRWTLQLTKLNPVQ